MNTSKAFCNDQFDRKLSGISPQCFLIKSGQSVAIQIIYGGSCQHNTHEKDYGEADVHMQPSGL